MSCAPPLGPPHEKFSAAETKKFQSRASFFDAMDLGAEKKRGGALRKKYQAAIKLKNFSPQKSDASC
jgi:hypothetical protein